MAQDQRQLTAIEPRLRYLSKRLRAVLSGAGGEPVTDDGPDGELDLSDDEMFDLIDKELGSA